MKCLLLLSVFFWEMTALAQQNVGNGGHGVKCRNQGRVTITSLDLFEARRSGLAIDLGQSNLGVNEKLMIAFERLRRIDTPAYEKYSQHAREFEDNVIFVTDAPPTHDEGTVSIPDHCELVQIVSQFPPRFPGDLSFALDRDLWEVIDNDAKASLILHEVFYRQGIANGATDSMGTRELVGRLASSTFETVTIDSYFELLKSAHIVGGGRVVGNSHDIVRYSNFDGRYYFTLTEAGSLRRLDTTTGTAIEFGLVSSE